ncbi:MAG: hypothetical protein MN733_39045, partial [Nitrososphaera sp.]|nr:hypothetical protein [Nitrososphaera sp.]
MEYRWPTREEKTTTNRALDRWGVFDYFKNKTLMIETNGTRRVCLMSSELESLLPKIDPDVAGMAIGQVTKQFFPSMPGADLFARVAKKNQYYVSVGDNAEKLILYGRDVMGDSILDCSEELDE